MACCHARICHLRHGYGLDCSACCESPVAFGAILQFLQQVQRAVTESLFNRASRSRERINKATHILGKNAACGISHTLCVVLISTATLHYTRKTVSLILCCNNCIIISMSNLAHRIHGSSTFDLPYRQPVRSGRGSLVVFKNISRAPLKNVYASARANLQGCHFESNDFLEVCMTMP
jgi:hypothetical protein